MSYVIQVLIWLRLINGRTLDGIIVNLRNLDLQLEKFEQQTMENALGLERQSAALDVQAVALRNEAERAYRVRSKVSALIE